ncbi:MULTISPECIES: hypothetical protein [Sorangium]|uniref:Uncharacterized protein n=1 Tax=Sorangium cellulosum TaxID=56 RepID=A0A4P2QTY4_SORCE|nr:MULTISPECIES: hypothetical protein [Sorangium]AUX33576.1 uncharacterized protein SOCE836_057360 [Sorangium cellulosum]WCQ92888.1 hypothetical protein NQZ70_05634 [Sorangium sp. Soce836]
MIHGGRAVRGGAGGGVLARGGALARGWVLALAGVLGALGAGAGCEERAGVGPAAKKGVGEACADGAECASSVCAAIGGVCSKGCRVDRECGAGYVCRSRDDGPDGVCSKPQGRAPGEACMTAVECQHGRCLHRAGALDQPGHCSAYCESADDCPAGLKICEEIADSAGRKMCLPGEGGAGTAAPGSRGKASER